MAKKAYIGVNNTARQVKKIYVGVNNVARKVNKGYIGVNNIARLFFAPGGTGGGTVTYYGTATSQSLSSDFGAATSVGDYALFGGGKDTVGGALNQPHDTVTAYNKSLVRSSATALNVARMDLAATTVGNYALFGGGSNGQSGVTYSELDAYNTSLTHTRKAFATMHKTLAATTVGNYAVFAGGQNSTGTLDDIEVYDSSLTRHTSYSWETLSVGVRALAATTVGNYALFGGGSSVTTSPSSSSQLPTDVTVFNSSFTSSVISLSAGRYDLAATTVGNYALFGGGATNYSTTVATVDSFNSSLTHSVATSLVTNSSGLAATSVNGCAIFGGGDASSVVTVYDESLTCTTPVNQALPYRGDIVSTAIGNYALFGGGHTLGTYSIEQPQRDVYVFQVS